MPRAKAQNPLTDTPLERPSFLTDEDLDQVATAKAAFPPEVHDDPNLSTLEAENADIATAAPNPRSDTVRLQPLEDYDHENELRVALDSYGRSSLVIDDESLFQSSARHTRQAVEKFAQATVVGIPRYPKEDVIEIAINGFKTLVPLGVPVKVHLPIYEKMVQSGYALPLVAHHRSWVPHTDQDVPNRVEIARRA